MSSQISPEALTYRSILPHDRDRIKALHEEFFPVKYSDAFYDGIIMERGIYGGKLHSIIAIDENQEVVAFLLGQFLNYPDQCEDRDLFSTNQPQCMYYILTVGVIEKYRRSGVASILVNQSIEYAKTNPSCGAVFLHVIHYNKAAMRLYMRNHFEYYRTLVNFYEIEGQLHTAYLYIYYVNGFYSSWWNRFYQQFGDSSEMAIHWMSQYIVPFFPRPDTTQSILNETNNSSNNNHKKAQTTSSNTKTSTSSPTNHAIEIIEDDVSSPLPPPPPQSSPREEYPSTIVQSSFSSATVVVPSSSSQSHHHVTSL